MKMKKMEINYWKTLLNLLKLTSITFPFVFGFLFMLGLVCVTSNWKEGCYLVGTLLGFLLGFILQLISNKIKRDYQNTLISICVLLIKNQIVYKKEITYIEDEITCMPNYLGDDWERE